MDPADDAQADWAPDGRAIAYRIRKPGAATNEIARMDAAGGPFRRLTVTPDGQASSRPAWFPDGAGILFRRSGPGLVAGVWAMGPLGESPAVRYDPDRAQWYPGFSPDMRRVLFATSSPAGDTDRGIYSLAADGSDLRVLFDVPAAYDSGPAWSSDGTRIAFESNADVAGANPERDEEIWVMDADGGRPLQLTRNALHDGRPPGKVVAFLSER